VRVLIVGSGGREHALAWRLAAGGEDNELHAAPGNPGIAAHGTCHPVRPEEGEGLLELAQALDVDLAVIGPEGPLVAGVADLLRHGGIPVLGPSAAAARIEGSKTFAKEIMDAAGVPTARGLDEPTAPCVVKADGLAAGKGVFVCRTQDELDAGLAAAAALGGAVVVEELLEGEELSVFALCDGSRALPLAVARDYKRAWDGDTGPNTGGMGSFSPVPGFGAREVEELVDSIHAPVIEQLARRAAPFAGVLFAGLMLTADGPRVLEFNCRFGDPETQSLLPRVDGDLTAALAAAAAGDLGGVELHTAPRAAVTVVVAGGDYPERNDAGSEITGVEDAEQLGALVFHAGTARHGDRLVTNGGRILGVTGVADDLDHAHALAYRGAAAIAFAGARYRTDVALPEVTGVA
jgi:phosphoribosylamine---glycine ligase